MYKIYYVNENTKYPYITTFNDKMSENYQVTIEESLRTLTTQTYTNFTIYADKNYSGSGLPHKLVKTVTKELNPEYFI